MAHINLVVEAKNPEVAKKEAMKIWTRVTGKEEGAIPVHCRFVAAFRRTYRVSLWIDTETLWQITIELRNDLDEYTPGAW